MPNLRNIRSKIFLATGVPAILAIVFIFLSISTKYAVYEDMSDVQRLSQFAANISALVHETQKERGMTGVFLNSSGDRFRTKLRDQRLLTDRRMEALQEAATDLETTRYSDTFATALDTALERMHSLEGLRQRIDSFAISASRALTAYTEHNASMLTVISTIAKISKSPEIGRITFGYYNFLMGKERAGIERAVMVNVFAQNRFQDGQYVRFKTLVTQQNVYADMFLTMATAEQRRFFKRKMADRAIENVQKMRDIAEESSKQGKSDFGINPAVWFDTITSKIDTLQQVEQFLTEDLLQRASAIQGQAKNALVSMTAFSVIALALSLALAFFVSRGITRPINHAVTRLKDIAEGEGDLTQRLTVQSRDEVGEMATWFNTFLSSLQAMIKDIADNAETLSGASTKLSTLSQQLADGAEETSGKSDTVATAAEEMSSNIASVAAAMEQATTNLNLMASSTEEMTTSVGEIAQNTETAQSVTSEAVEKSRETSEKINQLGQAAEAITKVTEVITEISEQTNLLALNATIEAARAGEAGKGFAVVANEIKDLAKQTSDATLEIRKQIEGVQASTEVSVREIEEIVSVISKINDFVTSIATAVEEQSTTTADIAENISQASTGVQEVNENVAQSSTVSASITEDIAEVNHAAGQMSANSSKVNHSADDLARLAATINKMVRRFKIA